MSKLVCNAMIEKKKWRCATSIHSDFPYTLYMRNINGANDWIVTRNQNIVFIQANDVDRLAPYKVQQSVQSL